MSFGFAEMKMVKYHLANVQWKIKLPFDMNANKILALCALMAVGGQVSATEYFVDSESGDDTCAGTSAETAWKTLAKVNAAPLVGGDVVRFRRGGLWRGSLEPKSGEPGRPVVYTNYGEGPKPIIEQSVDRSREEDWFEESPGLWSTRKSDPVVHEQVWKPSPSVPWGQSFQGGMRGTVTRVTEKGETFCRVTCTAKGKEIKPNYIQVWGPDLPNLPETAILRFKIRASRPFDFSAVHVMQGSKPFTHSHKAHMRPLVAIGREWTPVAVQLTKLGNVLTGVPKFHLNFGDTLPVGAFVDVMLEGVWRTTVDRAAMIPHDVGIFIVNHGERWGVKKWKNPAWTVPKVEKWQRSVKIANDLDFWYDDEGHRVVVKYPENPGKAFRSVELAMTRHVVNQGGRHDVAYDGLWVRYGAAHGFGGGSTSDIVIRNCDICWIGGGVHSWHKNPTPGAAPYAIRFGNGIEFWGGCRNILVERNRIWQIFDTAMTSQSVNDPNPQTDIVWRDNVIWQAEYSFEYWNQDRRSRTANVLFEHNTCVDAGGGWGHGQRPDPNGTHLTFFRNDAATTNFVVRNNIFCQPVDFGIRMFNDWRAKSGCHDGLEIENNLYYVPSGKVFVRYGDSPVDYGTGAEEFARYQAALGLDAQSIYGQPQFVDPARRDYRLKSGSLGSVRATDGGPMGARNMPGLEGDQSLSATSLATSKTTNEENHP